MNRIYHGIDLVDCQRIKKLVEKHGSRFLERVFTETERRYSDGYRQRFERLAGRFAVKEAVMKLLGTGWGAELNWTDIETVNDGLGQPMVKLAGGAAEIARRKRIGPVSVSITHTRGWALASALALGDGTEVDEEKRP